MADTKISALAAVVTPAATDEFAVNQGGTSKKITLAQVTGGTDTQVLYSNATVPAGDADLVWDDSGKSLTIGASTATARLLLPASDDDVTPTLAFGDGDTGLFESADVLEFSSGGVSRFKMNGATALQSDTTSSWSMQFIAASGTDPAFAFVGDENTGIGRAGADQLSLIAGALEVVRVDGTVGTKGQVLLPQESLAGTPTLAFGDGDSGIFENEDDKIFFSSGGGARWFYDNSDIQSNTAGGFRIAHGSAASDTVATFRPNKADFNTGIGAAADDQLSLIAGGVEGLRITEASTICTFDFDAGDNGAEQVGALTSLKSVSATVAGAAAATITATDLIPAGSFVVGITGRVETTFGGAIATMSIGDSSDADRWGTGIVTDGDVTWDLTDATASAGGWFSTAESIIFTGDVAFEASGSLDVIVHYWDLTAATA